MSQLLVTDRFLPHHGGSRIYYHEVCKRLGIRVLTRPEPGYFAFDASQTFPIIRRRGIRPVYLGRFRPKNRWCNLAVNYFPPVLATIFWTIIEVMKNRPEVIHAGGFLVGGFAALVAKKCFGIPWILYAHGEDIHSQAESRTLGRYLRWIFTSADAVIANSKFTRQLLTEKVGVNPKRIHLVNPGLDAKFFIRPDSVEAVQKKYGLVGKQALFTLGRLTPRKGHKQLIKALPSIIAEHPNLILVIASEGEERVNLEKMVSRMGLDQWVVFTGSVSDTEQVALYHACDIFILANRNLKNDVEGFGMVFLEAGAAGKPVIGGRSGGAVEAIREGRTGFLVDTEKPANIGDKISLLLDNAKLRAQLGQHGIAHARQFLWETQVPKITAIINQITKEISP